MAENIKIYPGRHFAISEITEVYLSYLDPTQVNWSYVETNAPSNGAKMDNLIISSDNPNFCQAVFIVNAEKITKIPTFNIIAIYTLNSESQLELLTYGILGVPQTVDETSQWYVNITLEWTTGTIDKDVDIKISLLDVYKTHTIQTSSPGIIKTGEQIADPKTIKEVHEKLSGLDAMSGTLQSQALVTLYESRVCFDSEYSSDSLHDLRARYTNSNILMYRYDILDAKCKSEGLDNISFGTIKDDPQEASAGEVTDADISNGGVLAWYRGSKNNHYDDVLTYMLDASRSSYLVTQDTSISDLNIRASNYKGNRAESTPTDLGDMSACIIGNFIFPELIYILKTQLNIQESEMKDFLDRLAESYKKATLYFDLKKGMGLFVPIEYYKTYIMLPCGTNDFVIRIFKLDDSVTIPNIETISPTLYIQQNSYYVQYANGKCIVFSRGDSTYHGTFSDVPKDRYDSSGKYPSNPWCDFFGSYSYVYTEDENGAYIYDSENQEYVIPDNNNYEPGVTRYKRTFQISSHNDMPYNYAWAYYKINDAEKLENTIITPQMNASGIYGDVEGDGPSDIGSLLRYYKEVVVNLKTAMANPVNNSVIVRPFDGISWTILDENQSALGITVPQVTECQSVDSITVELPSGTSELTWNDDYNLTYDKLYELYVDSYQAMNNVPGNHTYWLPHYYTTAEKGTKKTMKLRSMFNPDDKCKVFTYPELSTLDWDSLEVLGNADIENNQYEQIHQGLKNAFNSIRNLYDLYINSCDQETEWMFYDNAVLTVKEDSDVSGYVYINIIKYSNRYGMNLFRQVIPKVNLKEGSLKITYSSDVLTLKFGYKDAYGQVTNYSSLYDLNTTNPHRPVASLYSNYGEEIVSSTGYNGYRLLVNDLYYSNGVLFQTETLNDTRLGERTNDYVFPSPNVSSGTDWYMSSGTRLLRKMFNQYQ